jgi:hypothetical protein
MHAIVGESKMMPSHADQVPPSLSFRWFVDKESPLELLFFKTLDVGRDAALLYGLG